MKDVLKPETQPILKTLIITGSSGLIGSSFIDRVGESYHEMAFDREGPPHPPPGTERVIDCDLGSDKSVSAALEEVRRLGHTRIASIIHLAAYYSFSGEASPLYEQVTVRGIEVFSAPWNLLLGALLGAGLMAAPSLLGLSGATADSTHIVGALVATIAVVAFAEPARSVRFLNVLFGLWLLAAPWLLAGGTPAWPWVSAAGGLALIALSLRRGTVEDYYGGWQRFIH